MSMSFCHGLLSWRTQSPPRMSKAMKYVILHSIGVSKDNEHSVHMTFFSQIISFIQSFTQFSKHFHFRMHCRYIIRRSMGRGDQKLKQSKNQIFYYIIIHIYYQTVTLSLLVIQIHTFSCVDLWCLLKVVRGLKISIYF